MKLSFVIPIFSQECDILSFVNSVQEKIENYTKDYNIVISTNQDFEYVQTLHNTLPKNISISAVKLTDDYQQVVMAGVDKADGDATIIMTPEYDVELIDTMIKDWLDGKKVVCVRRKHSKIGRFFTKMRLTIYNLFLLLFGEIFSVGILKDAQLLDKEIVKKMQKEQDMAHRVRTMFAPLDYNTSVHDISHPMERLESKGTTQVDFWLGAVGASAMLIAFVISIILGVAFNAPIWLWSLIIIVWLVFEFLFIALLVNAIARVKIGILHNVDKDGKIYNLVQEYHPKIKKEDTKEIIESDDNVVVKKTRKSKKAEEVSLDSEVKKTTTKKTSTTKKTVKTNRSNKEEDNNVQTTKDVKTQKKSNKK